MHYSWETHVPLAVKFCYTRLQCGLYMHYSPVSFAFMSFINTGRMLGSLTTNSLYTILDKDIGPVRTKDAYTQQPASRLRRASCREHTAVNKSTTEQWRRHSKVECFQTIMNRRYFSGQGPTSQILASWRVGRIYTNVHNFANTGMPSHLSRARQLHYDTVTTQQILNTIPRNTAACLNKKGGKKSGTFVRKATTLLFEERPQLETCHKKIARSPPARLLDPTLVTWIELPPQLVCKPSLLHRICKKKY
jgi:hypothetical protein